MEKRITSGLENLEQSIRAVRSGSHSDNQIEPPHQPENINLVITISPPKTNDLSSRANKRYKVFDPDRPLSYSFYQVAHQVPERIPKSPGNFDPLISHRRRVIQRELRVVRNNEDWERFKKKYIT